MTEPPPRLGGAIRGTLIAYGVAAFSWLFSRSRPADADPISSEPVLQMIVVGVGLQLLMLLIRRFVMRYERANGLDGQMLPVVLHSCELIVDGVTVLLFAIATFRGIAGFTGSI